jgi:2-succinyl-5-enolpyruvyl-6-hydroxy-3-cyclohexene-1-carboxylate synthase
MNTSKRAVRLIADICRRKGVRKVVFSPGSRSSPLVIAFSQIPEIECIVIPDERVAGYFALGMAQQLREAVALVCTSGTAVLNLAPAVCEAFYQFIPLLVLTADRPTGASLKGENQAIMQDDLLKEYTVFSSKINAEDEEALSKNTFSKVLNQAFKAMEGSSPGPAHINIHLEEPLYETDDEQLVVEEEEFIETRVEIDEAGLSEFRQALKGARNKLVIAGMREANGWDKAIFDKLSTRKDIVIISESVSNFPKNSIWNTDACIASIVQSETDAFTPDVVISFGNQIVSKRFKSFLKKNKPKQHFDIAPRVGLARNWDMFDALHPFKAYTDEKQILNVLLEEEEADSTYRETWERKSEETQTKSREYLSDIPFSDLKVFETLIDSFPDEANIQYGNSTPVRYSNFFPHKKSLTVNANRGTSGIDGCVSTAAGAAYVNGRMTICVVGDISFFYDSNALWNNYLSPDFRIIVINNGGGNIFRLIDGPTRVKDFEKFFETKHNLTAKHLASMYGLPYYICDSKNGLEEILKTFYGPQDGKTAILEIKTDGVVSAEVYKKYFEHLSK